MVTLVTPSGLAALLRYLYTVMRYFFLPQWWAKAVPSWAPLVSVDHPLDATVPFRPDRVDIYLDFIGVWVRALSYMRERLGPKCIPDFVEFLDGLSALYRETYPVYRNRLSTTIRPAKAVNSRFRIIYLTDPHFFCVPSLHVTIVCYVFLKMEKIFDRHGCGDAEHASVKDLYEQALAITETVIYVRQHSVNCIPAALFLVTRRYPGFDGVMVETFVRRLFTRDPDMRTGHVDAIHSYILELYRRFCDEAAKLPQGADDRVVLSRFLEGFPVRK
jgi:hypothetical protein